MHTLDHLPFPTLIWTEYEWWEGMTELPAWAGFQSRGGPYGAVDAAGPSKGAARLTVTPHSPNLRIPTERQCKAYSFQIERGREVVSSVLAALMPYYKNLRADWASAVDAEYLHSNMPEVAGPGDFRVLIGLSNVHVHPYFKDDLAYVGLEFGCTWDEEHGFGVMLHGQRVVSIGDAAVSFAWEPDEATSSE